MRHGIGRDEWERRLSHPLSNPKQVLFIAQETAHFRELFRVARMLVESGRYTATFAFYTTYPSIDEDHLACRQFGIDVLQEFHASAHVRIRRRLAVARQWCLRPLRVPLVKQQARIAKRFLKFMRGSTRTRTAQPRVPRQPKSFVQRLRSMPRALLGRCGRRPASRLLTVPRRWSRRFGPAPLIPAGRIRRILISAARIASAPLLLLGVPLRFSFVRTQARVSASAVALTCRVASKSFNGLRALCRNARVTLAPRTRLRRLKHGARTNLTTVVAPPIRTFGAYALRAKRFNQILQSVAPDVLVLAEDNVGHMTGVFTTLARKRNCRIIVIPYTLANAREFSEAYFNVPEHQIYHWPNELVARRYPQWLRTHKDRRLMRMPGWHVLMHEMMGFAPPAPWIYNSGCADAILVESPRTKDYYCRAGLPARQLLTPGSMTDDVIARELQCAAARREQLFEELKLPPGQPLLLTAVPPDQLPSRPDCGFANYSQLVRAWLEPLTRQQHFNVVVRLHPRTARKKVEFIEREMGLRISELDTATLVALCDFYVASVSATIRWASACGKPVVNYDVYQYQYDDYDNAPGIVTMASHQEYLQTIHRIASDPEYRQQLLRAQQADMPNWGRLDGQSGTRILNIFDYYTHQTSRLDHANGNHGHGTNGISARPGSRSVAA